MPCSINASTWSAVTTRGLDTILPLPSSSRAVSSRFRNWVLALLNRIREKAPTWAVPMPAAGRLTLWASFRKSGVDDVWLVWKPLSVIRPPRLKRGLLPPRTRCPTSEPR